MKWWRVDRYYWRSDLDYKICWSTGPQDEPQFLAWAPRDPARPRNPGELLTAYALGTWAAARQVAEDHAAAQGGQDVG